MTTTTTRRHPSKKNATSRRRSPQQKFALARDEMNKTLIERDGEVSVLLAAVIAGENPLFVGDPGTGKSLMVDAFLRWIKDNVKKFSILMSKSTKPDEIVGPLSVTAYKEDRLVRITGNFLPSAHVAFLDEIFKSGSSIRNTMLKLMNEKKFVQDGREVDVPLFSIISASNEWKNEENEDESGAFFDRFLLRKYVNRVSEANEDRLLWEDNHDPVFTDHITLDEIFQAQEEAKALPVSDQARKGLKEILVTLREEGIFPGDRRKKKATFVAKAYAYLNGHDRVELEDLEILSHVLWEDPEEQREKAEKIIVKIANPTGAIITDKIQQIGQIVKSQNPNEAVPRLQEIQKELADLPDHPRLDAAMDYCEESIRVTYNKVLGQNK